MKTSGNPQLAKLRQRLAAWGHRIDAMSMRERVFMFLSAVAVLAATFDAVLISPLKAERDAQVALRDKEARELATLREQFVQTSRLGLGGDNPAQQRLAAAQQLQQELRQSLAGAVSGTDSNRRLPALLGTLLAQHQHLTLQRLITITEAPPHASGVALTGLQWQGVELQISGSYADQMKYLRHLEQAVPGLHWGELKLRSQGTDQPVLVQLRLYLLESTAR